MMIKERRMCTALVYAAEHSTVWSFFDGCSSCSLINVCNRGSSWGLEPLLLWMDFAVNCADAFFDQQQQTLLFRSSSTSSSSSSREQHRAVLFILKKHQHVLLRVRVEFFEKVDSEDDWQQEQERTKDGIETAQFITSAGDRSIDRSIERERESII